jgi:hypothetical protein
LPPSVSAPTEPLRIAPAPGISRSVLVVLFVLLTVAAIALGAFVLRSSLATLLVVQPPFPAVVQ